MEDEMKINPNMTRVNIRITKELHKLYKDESEKTGISMSILMYKDLEQMSQQRVMMSMLPGMMSMIDMMKQSDVGQVEMSQPLFEENVE
jgi:hypothetical protein